MHKGVLVACLLQNGWGSDRLPILFKPNPYNKSAKVINKLSVSAYFCNTTAVVTSTAKGFADIDNKHVKKVIAKLRSKYGLFKVLLICGKQAEKAFNNNIEDFKLLNIPCIIMKHPAARDLTNISLKSINDYISTVNKNSYSLTKIL